MLFDPKHEQYLGRLEAELHRARALTPDLMSDLIADAAAAATNHGKFVAAVDKLANSWKKDGLITGAQKDAILEAASDANIP